jgi:hypothetical protein
MIYEIRTYQLKVGSLAEAEKRYGEAYEHRITDLALKAYEHALEPKRLVMPKGGHFDRYLSQFEAASRTAVDWFKAGREVA